MMKEQHLSHFEAVSLVMITVDAEGKTKYLCLIRSAGHDPLDTAWTDKLLVPSKSIASILPR
jgi:hypothetical protein